MTLVTFLKRSSGWYWKNVSKYTNWNNTVQTIQELRETGKKDKVRLLCRARVAPCRWSALSWNYFSALPQRRGAGSLFAGHLPESQISGPAFPATWWSELKASDQPTFVCLCIIVTQSLYKSVMEAVSCRLSCVTKYGVHLKTAHQNGLGFMVLCAQGVHCLEPR